MAELKLKHSRRFHPTDRAHHAHSRTPESSKTPFGKISRSTFGALVPGKMSLSGDVCVVTGAFGFLGMRLVKLLLEEEKLAEIRLMDKHLQPDLLLALEGKVKRIPTF